MVSEHSHAVSADEVCQYESGTQIRQDVHLQPNQETDSYSELGNNGTIHYEDIKVHVSAETEQNMYQGLSDEVSDRCRLFDVLDH